VLGVRRTGSGGEAALELTGRHAFAGASDGYEQAVTGPQPSNEVELARQAAAAHAKAADDVREFVDRLSGPPDASELAEYDVLIAREEATRSERRDALSDLGFSVPSLEA
jgi:hypothetical protein